MKKIFNHIFITFLVVMLALSLCACGEKTSSKSKEPGGNGNNTTENKQNDTTANQGGSSQNNSLNWNGNFFGVELPQVANHSKVSEYTVEEDSITVRIEGVTYAEYKAYCQQLEALTGWEADEDENVASFPEDYNSRSKVYCSGAYKTLPHISVQYYSDSKAASSGYPNFVMFVYRTF